MLQQTDFVFSGGGEATAEGLHVDLLVNTTAHKPNMTDLPPLDTTSSSIPNGRLVQPGAHSFSSKDLQSASSDPLPSADSNHRDASSTKPSVNNTNLSISNQLPNNTSQPSRSSADNPKRPIPPPLQHRHTLEVPRPGPRLSREPQTPLSAQSEDATFLNGRLSPTSPRPRKGSLSLGRRVTRSLQSDSYPEDIGQDEDGSRLADTIRHKRASRRKRKDDEDDDRVVVGTKVDQNHVNWVTAYNMLTGIRFTVSRAHAKVRGDETIPLTHADFEARHKFSFDVTGNQLTPAAKYDFKFKDYAPEVFRNLRAIFRIQPADYLVSLTSKYILSELGSPGKSGSFFYFSRDYKYIIKTIHHAEHKFLRRILRDYYTHVQENRDTLLSQFYGLHRVKLPYGRKIHFVVMNNLFPPHRDIHATFDLKGSTIGRDFKEEDIEKHPRATLKDLNWIRRDQYLELGPYKKSEFVEQIERDVNLLRRLKIMDYSLLVGIHDLGKGNEENLRDKTLQVFQPGGDSDEDESLQTSPTTNHPLQHASTAPLGSATLQRVPTKLETERKAKELRQNLKNQKPIPLGRSSNRMPEEMPDDEGKYDPSARKRFYSDDGGFRATHEDNSPGEEIYYLGIIDCLTRYNIIKRGEHFFKGLTSPENEISAIPPDRYGNRFVKFIGKITVPREQQRAKTATLSSSKRSTAGDPPEEKKRRSSSVSSGGEPRTGDRIRTTVDTSDGEGNTAVLPVVEEAAESGDVEKVRSRGESANEKEKQHS